MTFRPVLLSRCVWPTTLTRRIFSPRHIMSAPQWSFDGLGEASATTGRKLDGIVFDVDGTLCLPQNYMFGEMRRALGIAAGVDILGHIHALPAAEQPAAQAAIKQIERNAMAQQTPQPGLQALMTYLTSRNVRRGLLTRNFDEPVNHLLRTFLTPVASEQNDDSGALRHGLRGFSRILTRSFVPPKPAPDGLQWIAREWGLEGCAGLVMVGDSLDDVLAGERAGAVTVVLRSGKGEGQSGEAVERAGFVVDRLDELIGLLERGVPGVPGDV